ncbi:hypothetical protein D3C81_1608550 [compost metagenome]
MHSASISMRTRVMSCSSAADMGATRKPRCGVALTRPSALRRVNASRTTPVLTPIAALMSLIFSLVSGRTSPLTRRVRNVW